MGKMQFMIVEFVREHPLFFIFALAIVVRVLLLLVFPLPEQGGSFFLHQRIADNILAQGDFGGEPQKTYGDPSINPGFAFFLVGWEFFFGGSEPSLVVASILTGAALAAGVYLFALQFFDKRIAFVAGITTALWPVFLIHTFKYGNNLMFYSTVLVFGVYFLTRASANGRLVYAFAAGVLLGFAMLTEAVGFFVPLVLVVWLFFRERSWRMVRVTLVFILAVALIVAPWTYRNVVVAEQVETQSTVSIVAKDELKYVSPEHLSRMARLIAGGDVLWSGLSRMYVFPYDISILDQQSVESEEQREEFSYKAKLVRMVQGGEVGWSKKELIVLGAKIIITLLHWLLLALAVLALVLLWKRREHSLPLLAVLLTGYVTAAVIGFGSLPQDDFQSISTPSSFIFPLVPLLIILAAASLTRLWGMPPRREALTIRD